MILIFFLTGLIIGSFLNVVIYRLDLAESIVLDRSHCPKCKSKISWYDNIPVVSFVFLKMRCRSCNEKISWQYPLIETFTGICFALIGYFFLTSGNFDNWVEIVFYLTVFSLMIVIFGYDIKFMEIPMLIVWITVAVMIAMAVFSDWKMFDVLSGGSVWNFNLTNGFLGGIIAALFFYGLVFVSKEKWMGMGDVYVGFLIGFLVGFPNVFVSLLLAFTGGSVFGLALIALKKSTLKTQIPFAPFLIAGSFATVFISQKFNIIADYIWPF